VVVVVLRAVWSLQRCVCVCMRVNSVYRVCVYIV
jgi:hypothetical protein